MIRVVTAEMRRYMPNACGDWADRIDAALSTPPAPASVADEANLEAQRQTIEACARTAETLYAGRGAHAELRAGSGIAAAIRALRPNESLAFAARPAGEGETIRALLIDGLAPMATAERYLWSERARAALATEGTPS